MLLLKFNAQNRQWVQQRKFDENLTQNGKIFSLWSARIILAFFLLKFHTKIDIFCDIITKAEMTWKRPRFGGIKRHSNYAFPILFWAYFKIFLKIFINPSSFCIFYTWIKTSRWKRKHKKRQKCKLKQLYSSRSKVPIIVLLTNHKSASVDYEKFDQYLFSICSQVDWTLFGYQLKLHFLCQNKF